MTLSKRTISLWLLGSMAAVTGALVPIYWLSGQAFFSILNTTVVAAIFTGLTAAYSFGWEPARALAVVALTLIVGGTLPGNSQLVVVLIPPLFALVLADAWWIAGSALVVLLMISLRSGLDTVYLRIEVLSSYVIAVASLVLGQLALQSARRTAEQSARRADAERAMAEQRSEEVGRQAAELNAQNTRQRELLELVSTLETPAVSVAEGVLLSPLVGNLDSRRAEQLTRRLLDAVHSRRIRLVILDIAGVPVVDTAVAGALSATVRALRLLGCEVVLTGISATVATTLTTIGVSLQNLTVAASPQDALAHHFGGR